MAKTLLKILPLAAALILALPAAQALAAPKPKVQFSSSAYAVTEHAGSATITVIRPRTGHSSVRLAKPVTVDYAATAGSAVPGTDFTPVSGTLSFPACVGTPAAHDPCIEQSFSVPILDDTVVDGPKTVNLKLSHAMSGATRAILSYPSSAVLVIADDDSGALPQATFQLAMASDVVSEGAPSATAYVIRSGDLSQSATVHYATADGTALAGTDYTDTQGDWSFPACPSDPGPDADCLIHAVAIPLLHNSATSPATRAFGVALSIPSGGSGVLGSPSSETITIVNIDGTPVVQWTAAAYSVAENAGSVRLTALVSGTIPASGEVDVDYATAPGSAKPGVNYTSQSDTLQFFADDVAEAVDVPVLDDGKAGNTYFTVGLANPQNAALGTPSTATVNIRDVQHPYTIPSIGAPNPAGNTPGAGGGANGGQIVLGARQSACGLVVKAAKRQKLLKKKVLVLKLRAGQACKVSIAAVVKQAKSKKRRAGHSARALRFKGKKVSLSLQPGKAKTVKVKFTKKTLKAIRKALRARNKLVATVTVTERAGSASPHKRTLRITIRR